MLEFTPEACTGSRAQLSPRSPWPPLLCLRCWSRWDAVGRSCPAVGELHGPREGAAARGPRRSPGEGQAGGAMPGHKMQSSGPAFRRGVGHTGRLCSPRLSAGSGTACCPWTTKDWHKLWAVCQQPLLAQLTRLAGHADSLPGTPCCRASGWQIWRLGGRSGGGSPKVWHGDQRLRRRLERPGQ